MYVSSAACKLSGRLGVLTPIIAVRRPELNSRSSWDDQTYFPWTWVWLWEPPSSKARNVQTSLPLYRGMSARCHTTKRYLCAVRSAKTTLMLWWWTWMWDVWYGASLSCGIFFCGVNLLKLGSEWKCIGLWLQNCYYVSPIIYTTLKSIFLHPDWK